MRIIFLLAFSLLSSPINSEYQHNQNKGVDRFIEGVHYTTITPKKKIPSAPKDKIVVQEFFWYGCPHCYHLEPYIERWEKPRNVYFERLPAVLGKQWAIHAYIYYALEALDKLDIAHSKFFDALHKDKIQLNTAQQVSNFFVSLGVKKEDLERAMKSFLVDAKVKSADKMARAYEITGVPSIIVNGHYKTSPSMTGSYRDFMEVVEYLVEKERLSEKK